MAILVRERIETDEGTKIRTTYRNHGEQLTDEDREQAKKLDRLFSKKMAKIEKEMEQQNLLDLVNSPGVLKLWYEVGKRLDFIFDPSIVPPEEREDALRALYDHTDQLWLGEEIPRRANRATENHFWYCYQLAQYDWELVQKAGNWTIWVEYFDSKLMTKDSRIIEWLADVQTEFKPDNRQDWVRSLNRKIRNEFENIDTRIFEDEELRAKLYVILEEVHGETRK